MSHRAAIAIGVGGLAAAIGAAIASHRASETEGATMAAVASGGTFQARLTGYWPFAAKTEAEKKMEGGHHDRKGRALHTLEQHLSDPVAHPFVSVSGDDAIFPYGQRIEISTWPQAVFRVTDTGGHFRGAGKVYRVAGLEPLDVCVDSSATRVPKTPATVRIIKGDHFDRRPGAEVATGKFRGQVVGILELLGAEVEDA